MKLKLLAVALSISFIALSLTFSAVAAPLPASVTSIRNTAMGRSVSFSDDSVQCVAYKATSNNNAVSALSLSCVNLGFYVNFPTLVEGVVKEFDNEIGQIERYKQDGLLCYALRGKTTNLTSALSCVKP